jgi:23S rRNA pseudouridine1911/1915/1917 synthase
VPEPLGGLRIDKALSTILEISRARARDLLDRGVLVDGARVAPSHKVEAGSVIETPAPSEAPLLEPREVPYEVIHEDEALIVVDKPPGLVVHPGAGTTAPTLAAGLLYRYPELEGVGIEGRWGLVHRLDRDTSGALLVGRTQTSYERLAEALARRDIGRSYTTLVRGLFSTETGTIEAPIGRDPTRPTRRAVVPGGKPAVTHYKVMEVFAGDGATLLEVTLDTGRTHQIRVHLAAIEHPVVGDKTYGTVTAGPRVPRIFLHAHQVSLRHPTTGEPVVYRSSPPPDLTRVLVSLGYRVPQ